MEILKNPAIVIRHVDYGEADRIVTFFSRDYGILKGFARSARKSRKRFGAALEPFAAACICWSDAGHGKLATLKEAEAGDLHLGLRRDLACLSLAAYGCELVEGLLGEGQAHTEAFDVLLAFLSHLNQAGASWESRLLLELRLLSLAGYAPHLLHCSRCGTLLQEEGVFFSAASGGSLCPRCPAENKPLAVSLPTLGSLSRSLQTEPTLFQGFRFSPRTAGEAHALITQVLTLHLLRVPKSLALLDQSMPKI